ncbi:hypothetical protein CLHUN_14640 [Ruminiclostridium hungatei]|uniref:Uncharacterized protein n=1 Tax=Ruminiclostridium hungatei TaxID=48256 RepID=A0A1V4SML9_RUMHU|nr:hypothetical protein [Ruminiclostridium hungatei]OPX44471.1 hypothetical protein CLHUN_14640 [Ruminiclostridium hungatei]
MENTLKIRYEKLLNQFAHILSKHVISENFDVKQDELFEEIDGKLVFVYDEDSGGEISLSFGEDETSSYIEVSAEHTFDATLMYELIELVINRVEVQLTVQNLLPYRRGGNK